MKKIIDLAGKKTIFESAIKLTGLNINYTQTSRYKMFALAQEFLNDYPELIVEHLSLFDIDKFIKIAKLSYKAEDSYELILEHSLVSDVFIFAFNYDEETESFYMLPKIKNYLIDFEWQDKDYEIKYFQTIAKGMIETYGTMIYQDLDYLYNQYRDVKYKKFNSKKSSQDESLKQFLSSYGYIIYKDGFVHKLVHESDAVLSNSKSRTRYSMDFYFFMGYYNVPIESKKAWNKLVNENKYHSTTLEFQIDLAKIEMQTYDDPEMVIEIDRTVLKRYSPSFLKLLYTWPIWQYGGDDVSYLKEDIDDDADFNNELGLIDEELRDDFVEYLEGFIVFADEVYGFYPSNRVLFDFEAYVVMERLIGNKDIIEDYKKSIMYPPSQYTQEFDRAIENAFKITHGLAIGYEEGNLMVYHNGNVYFIAGVYENIVMGDPDDFEPVFVNLIVLPLEDNLTYAISIDELRELELTQEMYFEITKELETAEAILSIKDLLPQTRH